MKLDLDPCRTPGAGYTAARLDPLRRQHVHVVPVLSVGVLAGWRDRRVPASMKETRSMPLQFDPGHAVHFRFAKSRRISR